MSPALLELLLPIVEGVSRLVAGPVEKWLIAHMLSFVFGHLRQSFRLGKEWVLQAGVSDEKAGIVTVSVYRSGAPAGTMVLYPLTITASAQKSIAAVLGVLFHEGEDRLLEAFQKADQLPKEKPP